ncbi:MAG TPA: Crp/Fnr family transcriptional regulator [Rhizomicrobium sp.]|jgi:CRP-like cAMP-binding protein|nr:Crp/Fnr family transcriptional regulator [Rhizomicrobium sp.]
MTAHDQPDPGVHAFLRRVFACSAEVAAHVHGRANEKPFASGMQILAQGDENSTTYLLSAGRAHALTYGIEGQRVLLQEFIAGDFFGALAALDKPPVEADVIAVEASRALVFLPIDFLTLIETHACVGLAVSRVLLRQLRATASRMVERSTLSAAGRVHAELLRLARLGDGKTIVPPPVLSALAVRVHSTRETVSRTIGALERRGLVKRDAKALVITAPHRLEELVV